MAIGKVNAYATVAPTNVDFGGIALNAQKFQAAEIDRLKDMIPKETKSDFKIKDINAGYERTTNGGYNESITALTNELLDKKAYIDANASSYGAYSPQDIVDIQKIENQLKGIDSTTKLFAQSVQSYSKDIQDGKFSNVDEQRFNYIEKLASNTGRNVEAVKDDGGNIVFKLRKVDEGGNFLVDKETKQPVYETFNDRGVEKDYITKYELDNNSFFNNTVKKLDTQKEIASIQSNIKPLLRTTDPNGTFSISTTYLDKDGKSYIDDAATQVFSDYNNLASYLYSLNSKKYSTPKTMKQYEEDGDIEYAKENFKKGVYAGIGLMYKEERVKPSVTNINVNAEDKTSRLTDTSSLTVSNDGKRALGYTVAVNQNSKINVGGLDATVEGAGYDNISKRFYISYYVPVSVSNKTSSESGESTKTTERRVVWLNGKQANVSTANTIITKLYGLNGKKYRNTKELINDIKSRDPDSKFFGGGKSISSAKTKTSAPGNSLIPPSQRQ